MADFDFSRSVSQRRLFWSCGHKYLLKYKQGWIPRVTKGTYAFGDVMETVAHGIVSRFLATPEAAAECFTTLWLPFKDDPGRSWTKRGPWELFKERGPVLAKKMHQELTVRTQHAPWMLTNERMRYEIAGVKELAIPDLVHPQVQLLAGGAWQPEFVPTVLDYKTSDRAYDEHSAVLDEQLSDYQLAMEATRDLKVKQVGLCVLVYTAAPYIQWLMRPARTAEELQPFIAKAVVTDRLIREGVFVRNERSCTSMGRCEYMSLCYPELAADRDVLLTRDPLKTRSDEALALDWSE